MNKIFFTGRLTKDPQLQRSSDGQFSYCRFSLAVDRGKNSNGVAVTDFPSVTAFGKTAENLCKYNEKGNLLAVEAEYRSGKYQQDGKTIYKNDIIAHRIEFLQWKKKENESGIQPDTESVEEIPEGFEPISALDSVSEGGSEGHNEEVKVESPVSDLSATNGLTDDDIPF